MRTMMTLGLMAILSSTLLADTPASAVPADLGHDHGTLAWVEPQPPTFVVYNDGTTAWAESDTLWKYICGSNTAGLTVDDLRNAALEQEAILASQPDDVVIVDNNTRGANNAFNVVFVAIGFPDDGLRALQRAETYIENTFDDPMTVQVQLIYQSLPPGVLGQTGSNRINTAWSVSGPLMIAGMDADDTIQTSLPSGSTVPVRYDGGSATVTQETVIRFNVANFNATLGNSVQSPGSISISSNEQWDFDPSDGVSGSRLSFQDVIIHEVGHLLGFVSEADSFTPAMDTLDLFRFQDNSVYDPSTLGEFQTFPRLVDRGVPDGQHICDLISAEYAMEDGVPNQASHLRQSILGGTLGLMEPSIGAGRTRYPNFYSTADLALFDAIGYDYPPCPSPAILTQPPLDNPGCTGSSVMIPIVADTSGGSVDYQWRKGNQNLANGAKYQGVNTSTLTILNVGVSDESLDYECVVAFANGCDRVSNYAGVTVVPPDFSITTQPQSQVVDEGTAFVLLSVVVDQPAQVASYQWRQDGVPITDSQGGRIVGFDSSTMIISNVQLSDDGNYDCVMTSGGSACVITSNAATLTVNAVADCPGDFDGSGAVDLGDLGQLLGCWQQPCGDLTGDNNTDLADLGVLLGAYGPCP